MTRNYKHEDAIETPARKAARAKRKQAERDYIKAHGKPPPGTQIDHRTPLSGGGGNTLGNLRAIPTHDNESYNRTGPGGKQIGPAKVGRK